jgi:hypothetical protein
MRGRSDVINTGAAGSEQTSGESGRRGSPRRGRSLTQRAGEANDRSRHCHPGRVGRGLVQRGGKFQAGEPELEPRDDRLAIAL